jgi:hypothetical protein
MRVLSFRILLTLTYGSLAKAELQLAVATVFRRFDRQELFATTRADVDIQHDLFLPQAALVCIFSSLFSQILILHMFFHIQSSFHSKYLASYSISKPFPFKCLTSSVTCKFPNQVALTPILFGIATASVLFSSD